MLSSEESLEEMKPPLQPSDLACILHKCRKERNLVHALRLHAHMQESGLEAHTSLGNYLVSMLVEVGSMCHAQQVFDRLMHRDECLWNSLITGYVKQGESQHALILYQNMQEDDSLHPSGYAFVALLKACTALKDLERGRELHAHIAKRGLLERNVFVGSTLVDMYAKCGSLAKAQDVFDKLTIRNVVLWNALITGYADHGHGEKALKCFEQMQHEGISPDSVTLVCSLKACGSIGATAKGWEIHIEIVRKGLERNLVVGSTLVDMYAKCGCLEKAQEVFDKLPDRNVVLWNALITGYVEQGRGKEVLKCIEKMQYEGISTNAVTLVCSLKACGSIGAANKGQEIHAEIAKKGLERDLVVGSTLVDMYAKSGFLAKAQAVFDMLPVRDGVLWNALITGYVEQGHNEEALNCFEQMQHQGVSPDSVTLVCSLKACGTIGAIDMGQERHTEIVMKGLERDLFIGSTLVDMYAKCGLLEGAQKVFEKLPLQVIVTWNALIAGYVEHDHAEEALHCFEQMQNKGISPDAVTLVCSLKACGSIRETVKGREIHAEIAKKGLLERDVFVGSTLVDVYAKCGLLAEAQEVFDKLPIRDEVSWTAIITGYAEHGHSEDAINLFKCMQHEGISWGAITFICILKAVSSIVATDEGLGIHAEITRKGLLERDFFIGSNLVDMYAKCGSLAEAQEVFDKLPDRDVVLWTTLVAGYAEHVGGEEALNCFEQMQLKGVSPSTITFVFGLKACGSIGATVKGQKIHAEIARKGLERVLFVANTLVDMHAKCGSLAEARAVFTKLQVRDVVSWTALMVGYAEHGGGDEALNCFEQMHHEGISPGSVTFVCSLKACGSIGATVKGQEIHTDIVKKGLERELLVGSSLVDMYVKCGLLVEAQEVFDKLPTHTVVSWNALIAGYTEHGHSEEALNCFKQMQQEDVSSDAVTLVCSLKACASIGYVVKGRDMHAEIARKGLERELLIGNILVDMYAKCGSLAEAQGVFDKLPTQTVISCTALIAGYAEQGRGEEALYCLEQMQQKAISLGIATFICSLKACGIIIAADKGRELHAEIVKKGLLEREVFIGSTLVDMYTKCGLLREAHEVLDKLPVQDLVSWTALIAGYIEHGCGEEALSCFEQMKLEGIPTDAVTLVCSLKACGNTGATVKGGEIHVEIAKIGLESDLFIGESLVDMYAKCGLLMTAQEVFDKLHVRNVVLWNALIAGYARLGESKSVFHIFDKMIGEGIKPDLVTFVNVLTACSHAGLVDKGQMYFEAINKDYNLIPTLEHYSCIVDLLGRAGCIDNVVLLIKKMPFHPDIVVWLTVLGACRKWGVVELGKLAFENAVRLSEKDAAAYVCLSNIYADAAMQEEVNKVEAMRVEKQAWKKSGHSWWMDAYGVKDIPVAKKIMQL